MAVPAGQDGRSNLLASIQGAGIGNLKKVRYLPPSPIFFGTDDLEYDCRRTRQRSKQIDLSSLWELLVELLREVQLLLSLLRVEMMREEEEGI